MTQSKRDNRALSHRLTKYISLPWLRAVQGIILAFGAPVGWMLLQLLVGRDPFSEAYFDRLLYVYMTVATGLVFAFLGYMIGRRERLITGMALVDGLTGLYNKRYFENRLFQEFSRYERTGSPVSLIQLDLDHFKLVNDTWGHQAGDEVLKKVSAVILNNCRANEVAARVGGEEICIIAIDCDAQEAMALAERLRIEIGASTIHWQDAEIKITSSFGVATATPVIGSALDLFHYADKALYQAKQTGRNRVCEFDAALMAELN